jgi:hypothetical protein
VNALSPTVKRCPMCKEEKEVGDFHKNRARKDGVDVYCKVCSRETKSPPAPCPHCGVVRKRSVGRQTYCSMLCRFWSKVDKTPGFGPSGTCWKWTGCVGGLNRNYGELWDGKRLVKAHRYSYELLVGPIPPGEEMRHKCDNPLCVNPDHLETGTHVENIADMDQRGRRACGEKLRKSNLTAEDILYIRGVYIPNDENFSQTALAALFGVSRSTIYYIVRRKSWSHI